MDSVKITILEDGTIKMETDKVSMPNHMNAEAFLRDISKLAGGEITRKGKRGAIEHSHGHGQDFHEHH
jgi:hypothetical protein